MKENNNTDELLFLFIVALRGAHCTTVSKRDRTMLYQVGTKKKGPIFLAVVTATMLLSHCK